MIHELDDFVPDDIDPQNPFNDPIIDCYKDFEGNLLPPEEVRPLVDYDEEYRDLLDGSLI